MAEVSLTPDVVVNKSSSELCKSIIKVGPWGVSGDISFDIIGTSLQIKKVVVKTGAVVDSLEISYYVDYNTVESYRAGGNGGYQVNEFELDLSKGEYINSIFGSVGQYGSEKCISELGFTTNFKKTHGPFGTKVNGTGFNVSIGNGRIVGFFGSYTNYIDEIGVYVA